MSMTKWLFSACLLLGLTVVTVGCDSKTAETPKADDSAPEVEMGSEEGKPAAEKPAEGDAHSEAKPAE
ncbi:hypothetical protein DTL42_20690 [Bremerella cremea]|uniref:Secreted protein n=1 Tax=Bremerella cremea TaxID=1031537 RepID=A0A368KM41_9BACT|nr:hypothetical protein [Bremerella cremea]RCS42239.1 hypothetical protein DTL42_20690 [Bremerella cremea]